VGRARDRQQKRAYAWEGDFMYWTPMIAKNKDIAKVISDACRMYRVPPPKVRFAVRNSQSDSSYYDPNLHEILILPKHREVGTALHEAAHAITDWIIGPWDTEAHGPEWLGVFITLLDRFKVIPRVAAEAHAKAKGLKFAASELSKPSKMRSAHSKKVKNARTVRKNLRASGDWEF
jgi:hypothetical protein